jgi:cytochrome c553
MPTKMPFHRPQRPLRRFVRQWRVCVLGLCSLWGVAGLALAADTSPAQQLAHWSTQAGQPGNATQGQAFFNQKHGGEWSCASCHGAPPTAQGKHANTGKTIAPLAPAFNPKAFTDTAKVEKWFRRNCNDVLARECTAVEKAHVLAYLTSLKPQ